MRFQADDGQGGEADVGPEDQPGPRGASVQQHSQSLFPSDGLQRGDAPTPLSHQTLHRHEQPRHLTVQNHRQDPRQKTRRGARPAGEAVERRDPGEEANSFCSSCFPHMVSLW